MQAAWLDARAAGRSADVLRADSAVIESYLDAATRRAAESEARARKREEQMYEDARSEMLANAVDDQDGELTE